MNFPNNALGTVRSTLLIVALLVGAFIAFHSYNWQLLSMTSWSQSSFASPHSKSTESNGATSAAKIEDISTEFPSSEAFSDARHFADESELANDAQSPKNGIIPGHFVHKRTKEKSDSPDNRQEFATMQNSSVIGSNEASSSVGSRLQIDRLKAKFEESRSHVEAAPPFDSAPHSERERAATGRDAGKAAAPLASSESLAPPKATDPIRKKNIRRYEDLSNIEKVEFDLWQARSAMRETILAQTNSSNNTQSVPDGEPEGDVYRNAAIFRQSYKEMEQRFKVYIYEEGEEPLVHNGPCKNIYAIEGRFIQELQGDNPFVTTDPEAAHVFFLPFSVAMMVTYLYTANSGDMSPLLRFAKDYINVVSRKYPYWMRSEGADHFMLACHDWGPHISRADENLVSKTIRVLCNANVSEGYIPTKDASLPEIHLVGGELPTELGGLPASERTILAFFAGGDHGPVRPQLFKNWEGKDRDILVYHQVPVGGPAYHTYMKSSKFCLCPGGYEVNSPRIVEAIYSDCVPVVIADKFVLPFSEVLDWKVFAVHVLEEDIPNLKTILEAIPAPTYIEMQSKIKQVRHHFLLNQPPQRYDVFHMILHSVWLRRINIQLLSAVHR